MLTDKERLQMTTLAVMRHSVVNRVDIYQPRVWNDEGIYDYFYIDFLYAMTPFSLGMFNESVTIDNNFATNIEKHTNSAYKVYYNLSNKHYGIDILGKVNTFLEFLNGKTVPPFTAHLDVSGLDSYKSKFYYDFAIFETLKLGNITETKDITIYDNVEADSIQETATFEIPEFIDSINENVSVEVI